jgi:hypothetical protein
MEHLIPNLSKFVPQLRATIMLSGCGHWTQRERGDRGQCCDDRLLVGFADLIAPVDRRRRCQLL